MFLQKAPLHSPNDLVICQPVDIVYGLTRQASRYPKQASKVGEADTGNGQNGFTINLHMHCNSSPVQSFVS